MKKSGRALLAKVISDRGSATVEFVAIGLPLFVPLFLFLSTYATQSDLESSLKTLSREMARAVVTSENDEVARAVSREVFLKGGEVLGLTDQIERGEIQYELICKERVCISPNNEIQIAIASSKLNHLVQAVEYVSPWA
jgi:hypothetical protein